MLLAPVFIVGCASHKPRPETLAELRHVRPDLKDAQVDGSLDQAVQAYRRYLEETPVTAMTPEAIRRLADLQVEKQFGIHPGQGTGSQGPAGQGAAGQGMLRPIAMPLAAEKPAVSQADGSGTGPGDG
jgi:hypothetical protein